jgi:hypothetical protein
MATSLHRWTGALRRIAGVACVCAALAAAAGARADESSVQFYKPGDIAAPLASVVTVDITASELTVDAEFDAALDSVSDHAGMSPVDLAALAYYAQAPAEEIHAAEVREVERPFRPITDISVNAALPAGAWPGDAADADEEGTPPTAPEFYDPRLWGGWAQSNYQWAATSLCHRPLYFEQVNLERYGYTVSPILQPAISGAHFFLTIPTLPYKMVVQPPRECVYTLGYYRAGSRAPRRWHHMDLVWDPTAVAVEGLLVTGLVFLIP